MHFIARSEVSALMPTRTISPEKRRKKVKKSPFSKADQKKGASKGGKKSKPGSKKKKK